MKIVRVPLERIFHGNENWRSNRAIGEVEIYCDLLETLQERIEALETRGKSKEASLGNVQAVISSYAFEIAMKSLWALDNSPECVKHTHNLLEIYDELKHDTKDALSKIGLTKNDLVRSPKPFFSNRYSMEESTKDVNVYKSQFLRLLVQLVQEKLAETLKEAREAALPPGFPIKFFGD